MAKRNELLQGVLWIGGGYVVYKVAAGGGLGTTAKTFALQLRTAVSKMFGAAPGLLGAPTPPPAGTPPPPTGGGFTAPPMDANNFVAPYASGWVVWVNGSQVNGIYATQGEAERAYNTARGFPN